MSAGLRETEEMIRKSDTERMERAFGSEARCRGGIAVQAGWESESGRALAISFTVNRPDI